MLNKEQLRIALRLKARAEKLQAAVPARLEVVQADEDADAETTGRQARDMSVEPIVEIGFPLLAAILEEIGDAPPEEVAETVQSYRKSCKFFKNRGTTNVHAWQLLKVMEAAGVTEPAADSKMAAPMPPTVEE